MASTLSSRAGGCAALLLLVVLLSLAIQGWTVAPLARRLGLELTELHRVNVPMPDEMRPGGTKSTDRMDIVAYRYRPATLPPPG